MLVASLLGAARPAAAERSADRWLEALYDRVAEDLSAGKPLIAQVHVPLCDNRILACGNERLGDGDNPRTNLYWATSGGFVGWFNRRGSGWKEIARLRPDSPDGDLVEVRVWSRRQTPGPAWRARGVRKPFEVLVVAYAWRGRAIDAAVAAYARDLFGDRARSVETRDGRAIAAGGAAHVVAYVGHNRWMDVPPYEWPPATAQNSKGTIAIACKTEPYLAEPVAARDRVPLLMTRDFLFAGAHAFEGAISAFAAARSLAAIRESAAATYARGQGKPVRRVRSAFTNPADRRWNTSSR